MKHIKNMSINTILNQLMDAGKLRNMQGGYIDSRIKLNSGEEFLDTNALFRSIYAEREKTSVFFKLWYWYIKPKIDATVSEIRALPFRLKNGFDYRDCWNLDYNIAKYVLPRLKFLKDPTKTAFKGYPCGLTMKKWEKIQGKMIYAFEKIVDEDYHYDKKTDKKINEGLELFGKYFRSLWD